MKLEVEVKETKEIDIKYVEIDLPVRYEEEDMPNDYPGRNGETWNIVVEADTGVIQHWPNGVEPRQVYMKVVDGGCYYLRDSAGRRIAEIVGDYVPRCIPGEYGDYVDFNILADGRISNWKQKFTEQNICDSFFDND